MAIYFSKMAATMIGSTLKPGYKTSAPDVMYDDTIMVDIDITDQAMNAVFFYLHFKLSSHEQFVFGKVALL